MQGSVPAHSRTDKRLGSIPTRLAKAGRSLQGKQSVVWSYQWMWSEDYESLYLGSIPSGTAHFKIWGNHG